MHLIFEENPHENSYSNCTILTLAWTPFYDDDLFRQYLRGQITQDHQHVHQQQQQLINPQSVEFDISAQQQPQQSPPIVDTINLNINGVTPNDNQQLHHHQNLGNILTNDPSEYRKKFTDQGRSDNHGWLAVGNINGVVGVSLTKCSSPEEESTLESDHDEELQDEERSPNDEEKSVMTNDANSQERNADRKVKPRRATRNTRIKSKRSEKKAQPVLNHHNNPDDEAFKTNHHLRGHGSEILIVKWNEPYQRLATVDSKGCIFIWSKRNGRFQIESPLNNRNKTVVDFDWSNDGETALICYVDSFVLVGSGYGQRYWHSMLNLDDYHITCGVWSPDDEQLIFGVSNGSILVIYLQNSELTELTIRERFPIRSMCWSMGYQSAQRNSSQKNDNSEFPPAGSSNRLPSERLFPFDNSAPYGVYGEQQDNNNSNQFRYPQSPPLWANQPRSNLTESLRSNGRFNLSNNSGAAISSASANSSINTNYYRLNRINTAIRWRQQSTAAMYNSNQRLCQPNTNSSSIDNDTPRQSTSNEEEGGHSTESLRPQPNESCHITTDSASGKNVLAVDFCDGTIQLYSGGLEDPDPRTITTNLKSLHMQWSHDGSLLAVAGFYTVSSLSLAISLIERRCSGRNLKEIAESLALESESEKRVHPMMRPNNYYLNVVHFYTPQGNLRYSQFIKYCAHPVSALTWGHKDRRLFVATGPVLHTAHVYTNVPSLQILAKTTIKRMINVRMTADNKEEVIRHNSKNPKLLCQCYKDGKHSSQLDNSNLDSHRVVEYSRPSDTKSRLQQNCEQVFRLPLPTKLLQTIDNMFARTLRCQIPTSKNARDFIWKVPTPNKRFFCTLICYESQYTTTQETISTSASTSSSVQINGSESNYILYLEYLGSLIPILKAKLTGHLKPEFIIFDPQTQKPLNTQAIVKSPKDRNVYQSATRPSAKQTAKQSAKQSSHNKQQQLRDGCTKTRFNNLKSRLRSKSATPSLQEAYSGDNLSHEVLPDLNSAEPNRDDYSSQSQSLVRFMNGNQRDTLSCYLDLSLDTQMARDNYAYDLLDCDNATPQWAAIADETPSAHELRHAFKRHLQYLHHYHAYDNLPEQRILARVKSNFWGTKFKIIGCDPLPENIATMVYKTSLLHLQPRQVCITIKDLETVCSNCFGLTDAHEKKYIDDSSQLEKASSSNHYDHDKDFSCDVDDSASTSVGYQSSSTVFLEVGDNLRIAPMSCTHRPVNNDSDQQIFVGDTNSLTLSSVRHRRRTHRRDKHLPSSAISCENIYSYDNRSRATSSKLSSTIDHMKVVDNRVKSSKKRPSPGITQQQNLDSTCAESPSKKLALDNHQINDYKSKFDRQSGCYNFVDDDDDILTLYMDKKSVGENDKDEKERSTTSISMKMSSRCSSNNELYPTCSKRDDLDQIPSASYKGSTNNVASFNSTGTPTETSGHLLSISAITKMIVDLSSKAAKDDDLLVDTSIKPEEDSSTVVLNHLDSPREDSTILPPVPQTPVHRPRRRTCANVSKDKNTSQYNSPKRSIGEDVQPKVHAIKAKEGSPLTSMTTEEPCHVWSDQVDDCSMRSTPPQPPKRKFTKKLREQFKKSAMSLNIGSSFGSCADYDLHQPLLRDTNEKYRGKEDSGHLMTQSQPCTPLKKKRSMRGCYENAGLEERLQDLSGSYSKDGINNMVDGSLGHNFNSEDKENNLDWDTARPRRCQSTTKLVTKAIQRRFTYFDCTSSGEINCVRRPNLRSKENLQNLNATSKINSSESINKKAAQSAKCVHDESQGPKIDKYLNEHILLNKPPVWNAFSQVYQLDFGGRVTQESAKNFQIEYQGQLAMQFGRIDNRAYTLDFQYPFNAVQAMGVALASLTQRLK